MDESAQKEQFSNAYLHAVASVAGYAMSKPNVDADSVDWTIAAKGAHGTIRSPKLDIQLKCTSKNIGHGDTFDFDLPAKNYSELRSENPEELQVPRLLVVVVVPNDIQEWLHQSEERLKIRRCAYWHSLYQAPETPNKQQVRIKVSRDWQVSVNSLTEIMHRIGDRDIP